MTDARPSHEPVALLAGVVSLTAGTVMMASSSGGGGLFLAPLVAYPLAVGGGTLLGYAAADARGLADRRAGRLLSGIGGGILGFVPPYVVYAMLSTAPPLRSAVDIAPYVLGLAVVLVGIGEIATTLNRYFSV